MGFITGIVGAIGSALGWIGNAGGAIAGGVGDLLNNASGAITSLAGDVADTLGKAVTTGVDALTSSAEDVFNVIDKSVGDVISTETSVLGEIAGFVDKVSTFVNRINDEFIKPVTDSVLKTYDAISSLTNELHTDLHDGIKGLLNIPDALAGALTTVDAQLGRAMQELGLANREVVTSDLLPGMGKIFDKPLSAIGDSLSGLAPGKLDLLEQLGKVQLSDCTSTSVFETKLEQAKGTLTAGEGWVGEFGKMLMTMLWALPYLTESVRNDIECFQQAVNEKNPVKVLDVGNIVKAMFRGVLDQSGGETEALKLGISRDRLKVIHENQTWLPGAEVALRLLHRGAIDEAGYRAVLAKQGFSDADASALLETFLQPPDAKETMAQYARQQAADANFLPSSLGSPVPGPVAAAYTPRFLSEAQAKLDWLAHWKVPQLEWWFTAWTRGMRTREEFRLAAQAENVPFDVIDDLIGVFQEPIQLWMIPDMLGAGILSDIEAQDYLHYIGMDDKSTSIIMKYGKTKLKAPAAAQAAELAKISAAQAKTMYDDGIISEAQYTEILTEHGFPAEAATLTVQLAKQQLAISTMKAYITSVIDAVNAGVTTEADAVADLFNKGATQAQVDAAIVRMHTGKAAKAKMPSRAELDDFLKDGVINVDQWTAAYVDLGYSDKWIPVFLAYLEQKSGQSFTPSNPV